MKLDARPARAAAAFCVALLAAATFAFDRALAAQAAEGGPGLMSTFTQGRATIGAVIGTGTALTMVSLWIATRMAKRKARKTISAYDRQLEAYSRSLRRNAG